MNKIAIFFLAVLLGSGLWWSMAEGPLRDPTDAIHDFYEGRDRAEDQLMDPLILNGRRVVPLILADLPNKEMKRRRYAIGFLGNGRYYEALPALEKIVSDESEVMYFRLDALEAIFQISPEHVQEFASRHFKGEDYLGEVAKEVARGSRPPYPRRLYLEAFFHVHN